jgi:hypothetical protein
MAPGAGVGYDALLRISAGKHPVKQDVQNMQVLQYTLAARPVNVIVPAAIYCWLCIYSWTHDLP